MNYTNTSRDNRIPKKKNIGIKILSLLLVCSIMLMFALPVFASTENTEAAKQEVVYISLSSDGSVSSICVVNIFELDEDGAIVDYGDYTSLRNMTGNEQISFENETVYIDAKAGRLYYEGTLNKNIIPWIFSFRYFLDGKEYTADDIAGKDGALEISISIRENPDCNSSFFENYGLQASVTLDTELCRNIVSDGATAANVGKNRQLTYMILPGSEKDIRITADVTDFEMAAIAINGLQLNMGIDTDSLNTDELTAEADKLKDAAEKLDTGAGEVKDGAGEIMNGASELKDGASSLHTGISDATDGMSDLSGGLSSLSESSEDLRNGAYTVFLGMTSNAEAELNQYLTAAGLQGVTLTPETYGAVLTELSADIPVESEAYGMCIALKQQLDSYNSFYIGLCAYTAGVDYAASGAATLNDGLCALKNGSAELVGGITAMHNGTAELYNGAIMLKNGTSEFKSETDNLDITLKYKIENAIGDILGNDFEVISFVSEKNKNVKSVQFVIQTEAIAIADAPPTPTPAEEKLNFWQKLLRLFDFNHSFFYCPVLWRGCTPKHLRI